MSLIEEKLSLPLTAWLEGLFERSPDLFCVHDLSGRILAANPSACEALGYSLAELAEMTIQKLLTEEARCLFQQYLDTLVATGTVTGRMSVRTRSGERRTLAYRNVLTGGESPVIAGIARDVTVRDAAFHALLDSESHFRGLIEHGPDLIGIIAVDGSIRYISPSMADMLDDGREFMGKQFSGFVHESDRSMLAERCARASRPDGPAERIELRMRTRNGAYRSYEVMIKALVRGGRTRGLVLNARDITDRKFLEQQLEQATRLTSLGRLAATVAHEFNNVLMGMLPFVEILRRSTPSEERLANITGHLLNSLQRGKTVTRDMLRFTRPAEPRIQPLALKEWWDRFLPEAQAVIGDSIHLNWSVEPLTIMADGDQLSQIFSNLVANARDAMPGGGTLGVRVRVPGESETFSFGVIANPSRFAHISVEDSGTGIPPELLRHVFEPLFTTKAHGGTGLGLTVAHQVITRHGGFIFVESHAGHGTTFHLFLPRAEALPAVAAPLHASRDFSTRRVLLVDDEQPIVDGLTALLAEQFEITAASSGEQALALVDDCHPDVVVLDIGLPDMDGSDVARFIRDRHATMPIIFATGHGDSRHVALGPLVRFLQKPFDIEDLLDAVAELEREAGR